MRYLDQALASCRQARDLIQQMLTFSRGQRGSPRPLALADAVAESLKLLRSSLPSSLELATDLAQGPVVMLDPVQLDQILLNLTINARDAMAGIGRIDVAVHTTKLPGKAVCASCRKRFRGEFAELQVADSGPGIAPRFSSACSSLSSPPRTSGAAAAWGSPRCTASCTSTAAT